MTEIKVPEMKFIQLRDDFIKPLPFYLAMEEYYAHISNEELFFIWNVNPTVIIGRNQIAEREVNIDYCNNHNISLFRRKSGGGCVYADQDNLMLSYITSSSKPIPEIFAEYTSRIAEMLCGLGLNAKATGRNDILIGERKVSGNAFYHIPGRSIIHGTMLLDTNVQHMLNAISPSKTKLTLKGVESVRSRITTIHEYLPDLSRENFIKHVKKYLCNGEIIPTDEDIKKIEEISKDYFSAKTIFGKRDPNLKISEKIIPGVGEFQVQIVVDSEKISYVNLFGDFFITGDIDNNIIKKLIGKEYNADVVRTAIADTDLSSVIPGLTTENLITLLF